MEVGNLAHSHSQPGGMDRTPPGTPKKGGKMLAIRVQMLDDTVTMFQVQAKALGRVLFDQVCNQLNLLESDYFGLEYQEAGGTKYWLDLEKPLCRQIGLSLVDTLVKFCVKFYTPDPSQLEEEFTRYLFCLQIKRDLSQGLLQCNINTAALMASYIVQAECGDYVVEDYPDHRYLSSYKFVPNQDQELERRIMENHKKHTGQSPAEADLNLLETARRCELYGIKMHSAKDHEGCPLNLAVAHMGIVVFQNFSKINTFSWAKIRKISFKRKRFLVKLHPEGYGYYKDTVEFFFEGRNECKNFWKKCVENHGFFRCTMVKKVPRQKTRVLSRGSSFRYSGRTQKQVVDFVRENYVKRQTFQRSQSFRHSSSAHSSVANVGTSISAHPLLPLGDNAVAGTPASLSCGSMTLTSSPVHIADIHAGASPSPPLTTSVSPGTSVTSSPQHFYPQETPYRQTDHRLVKVKRPPVHSRHAVSSHSPTDAATAATNHSASHSSNIAAIDSNTVMSSRNSLKSPEFIDFNDVYSNCYTSLRSLGNVVHNEISGDEAKTDIFSLPSDNLKKSSMNRESVGFESKNSIPLFPGDDVGDDKYTWHRSASCKELYKKETNVASRTNKETVVMKTSEPSYELNIVTPVKNYDTKIRKCHSAVTSKNPSVDRTSNLGNEMRIFSSSYPGTMSSLSTESAEGELDDQIVEVLDLKYDSQEEIALSHDDVSHDSYELIERELDDYAGDSSRSKRSRIVGDNERTRSCSWGSDRGISPLDFRSSEIMGSGLDIRREQNFWSLEREKILKHKSEIDFRSFSHKILMGCPSAGYKFEANNYSGAERKEGTHELLNCDSITGKRSREIDGEMFESDNRLSQWEKRIVCSKSFRGKELSKSFFQEIKLRRASREEKENYEGFEKKRYQSRRKSLEELGVESMGSQEFGKELQVRTDERRRGEKRREKKEREERFHEGLKEKEQKEREKEKRQTDRRKNVEEKEFLGKEEPTRKIMPKSSDYTNFQEIHFKKFDRVVSNQFGKYPEFLTAEKTYEFLAQEKKVMENYEKVCQVSRLAKELKMNDKISTSGNTLLEKSRENSHGMNKEGSNDFGESNEFHVWKNTAVELTSSPKVVRAHVERTKSDPYNAIKNQKRNLLMHQKSIDLTPQHSEEITSDYDNDNGLKKASRSEHDIPYILHKRHCMNGTAKNADAAVFKMDFKATFASKNSNVLSNHETRSNKPGTESKKPLPEDIPKNTSTGEPARFKQKPSSAKVAEAKKAGVQIINLDLKDGKTVSISESKKVGKFLRPLAAKAMISETKPTSPKTAVKKETKKIELPCLAKTRRGDASAEKGATISDDSCVKTKKNQEPIYSEVFTENTVFGEDSISSQKNIPPDPPKRTSSFLPKSGPEEKLTIKLEKKTDKFSPCQKSRVAEKEELPAKMIFVQKASVLKPLEEEEEKINAPKFQDLKAADILKVEARTVEAAKVQPEVTRVKQDASFSNSTHQRREESLTLFARTRLGLSEGSAFAPVARQGRMGSPFSQRRAKSLDAPYVSVHSLPPADAFSSKDDTVDGNENDIVDSALAKFEEFCKGETKKYWHLRNGDGESVFEPPGNTESEVDSVFTDDLEMESNFKKAIENQSKVDIPFLEEKVLDGVRGRRLLSKIESIDFVDSEGDLDSSKMAEPSSIPSDRLVNLPESIRFPSVRQISGQTSEESADGWDQKEVKVKRRTPRKSIGREEQDNRSNESVVWDSKDDELPEDDVWDENIPHVKKYEGAVVNVGLPAEYLKRGSCGQSIDDDNLSTPMKESSPEHWVSVDDLPEAIEREEKLLKQQEKILREKILNEKLKRELNLDTIDIDDRYCDYKSSLKKPGYEEEPLSLKENIKGHSLDTYELNEKKSRERGGNKNSSLDEGLLPNKLINSSGDVGSEEKIFFKSSSYRKKLDYIQCKVVKDVAEIDQFGDNDEELEEFFVVLDDNLGKDGRSTIWDEDDTFGRTPSNDESLISVPDEFKDVEKDDDGFWDGEKVTAERGLEEEGEIRVNEGGGKRPTENEKSIFTRLIIPEKLCSLRNFENGESSTGESKLYGLEGETLEDVKLGAGGDSGRLPAFSVSRRDSEENRRLLYDDTGCLSPHDNSSRRSSDDPRRLSASEDAGHLSPFEDSRRGSEDLRRLSASEDSRKCSVSESVSEETRRRLSSTEETRRKRASLTKQCSIGAESLSDEVITGIQECSSSFEHDEKDVFEPETGIVAINAAGVDSSAFEIKNYGNPLRENFKEQTVQGSEMPPLEHLEIEICEEKSTAKEILDRRKKTDAENASEINSAIHLAPPPGERELSRETEDSVDYGEGDFKDIREVVKEKDICEDESIRPSVRQDRNLFEKSECLEGEDLLYIDDKRGSTPEILLGRSKEAVAVSIVVVNEGISVLNRINEKDRKWNGTLRTQSLPRKLTASATGRTKAVPGSEEQRHTLPKTISKPKPLTPKPVDYVQRKLTKSAHEIKRAAISPVIPNKESINLLKSNLDSSQESDLDKLSDLSLVSHVQYQIARRNLFDAGKCLKSDELGIFLSEDSSDKKTSSEDDAFLMDHKTSSEEKEKTENSSFELKSSADELVVTDDVKSRETKEERRPRLPSGFESSKAKKKVGRAVGKEKRSPEQEKRGDSGEDGSSSSSGPLCPKRELSSTWKPFLLESSGSSSLEEGWLPPDENAHLADEEETSSTSNNQQDDSCHDDIDYPTGIGFPVLNVSSAEMMVSGYGSVFALSRTLSRISERSTSEQERSDLEDDITKPSSHSVSAEEESIMSSDHQPSLSSDPPSPRESASTIPDLPVDNALVRRVFETSQNQGMILCEPFGDEIPPPLPEQDWPLPFSFDVVDTPVVSHVETVYMEINPEQACKVVVTERHGEGNSSSDENPTFQEESEFLHLSSDNVSASTTTTTQDGTVVIPVRPITGRTSSLSEDASMISTSERSSSTSGKLRPSPTLDSNEDASERSKGSVWQDLQTFRGLDPGQSETSNRSTPSKYCKESYFDQDLQKPKMPSKIKPLKLSSPTGKTLGFFETPVSKVRSPTSQIKFFDAGGKRASGYSVLQSPTSFSEATSPKNYGHFFESFGSQILVKSEAHDLIITRSPTKGKCGQRCLCTPYYSNVADSAEKSYFGRYDTGSLERTKIHSSRKCSSYYSVSKITPSEGNSSNSEEPHAPSPNTIPRASKKKRRHKVAMDLVVRNGKIVVPPKTKTTVLENSDSDRSSPKECRCENTRKTNSED